MTQEAGGRLGRRLSRILVLLPYAIRHPGVTVDELARKFGVARAELIRDLQLVFLCGLPGYSPGDLIEVTMDDDVVHVRMADYFSLPLRLTPTEALTLYAGGEAIAALPGMEQADALRRALAKLRRALGRQGEGGAPGVSVELEGGPSAHLEELREALAERRRARIEYLSATTGQLKRRAVDPWGLVAALGRWYLVAWDHLSQDERMFRVDRIKSVELTDERVEPPADFDPDRYRAAWSERDEQETMRLEISPGAAGWFTDYYPTKTAEVLEDGWQAIEVAVGGETWAATLLLRLGSDARAVEPASYPMAARQLARAIAARHGSLPDAGGGGGPDADH